MLSRKQYFYPDVSKNYQVTQFEPPLCSNGKITITTNDQDKVINITRIHLEEDAGKLVHDIGNRKLNYSLVDLNRAGIGLMEIVSEPEMNSAQEAFQYVTELKNALEYLETSQCNMEEGQMRCDVNVSIRPKGQKELGTRVEIKNLNSISAVRDSITYEVERQKQALETGRTIIQETRLWDCQEQVTKSMRSKEEAMDYRYFPEPDIVPFDLEDSFIENIKQTLPELPQQKRQRFIEDLGLSQYDANVLSAQKLTAAYYEKALSLIDYDKKDSAKPLANWVTTELAGKLNASKLDITQTPISEQHIANLVTLVLKDTITGKIAKSVFEEMFETSKDPQSIVKDKGLVQITDESAIEQICKQAIDETPKAVNEYKSGKKQAIGALVGVVMRKSKGQANPQIVNKILAQLLEQ